MIRIRLTSVDSSLSSCSNIDLDALKSKYRGSLECLTIDGKAAVINELSLDDYLLGLAEEPDTEPYEKQRAFAIAARTYAAWYMREETRKFPGMPYDGSDSPATFQKYTGKSFEGNNPRWLDAVRDTANTVLTYKGELIKPPYFSSDDGRTRTPKEAGWNNFPFAEIFSSKEDPWCAGMENRGHGVGMSGCGAEAQAHEGKTGEEILQYYYPGTKLTAL
jgi:peptidoglycan hydrolase-like amidase